MISGGPPLHCTDWWAFVRQWGDVAGESHDDVQKVINKQVKQCVAHGSHNWLAEICFVKVLWIYLHDCVERCLDAAAWKCKLFIGCLHDHDAENVSLRSVQLCVMNKNSQKKTHIRFLWKFKKGFLKKFPQILLPSLRIYSDQKSSILQGLFRNFLHWRFRTFSSNRRNYSGINSMPFFMEISKKLFHVYLQRIL